MFNTIFELAKKELVNVFRSKVILINGCIVILLLMIASCGGYQNYRHILDVRTKAQIEKRQQWLHQDPKHPHIAAHFGTFAYKPKTALSLIDMGLDNYSGTYEYLEPHHQNDFVFKPSEENSGAIRFGQLSVALVLQLLVPLLIIFMGFASITDERENSTLKLLFSNGISLRKIAFGKVIGLYTAMLLILLPALVLTGLYFFMQTAESGTELFARALLMGITYSIYFLIFTVLTVFVSAICKKSRSALLVLLGCWISLCIIMPKAVANIGDNIYALPSQYAFKEAIQKDVSNGLDGHNSKDKRAKLIEKELLARYHVDSVSKLPFNFEGYIMEAGEEYSSMVYDKYFHRLQQTLTDQDKFGRFGSFIDPYLAIQNISMGLSSTDIFSHIDFQQRAEAYRRGFVQTMNEDMKDHSRLGDWNYKVSKVVYASIPDFNYNIIPLSGVIAQYSIESGALLLFLIVITTLMYTVLNRMSILYL